MVGLLPSLSWLLLPPKFLADADSLWVFMVSRWGCGGSAPPERSCAPLSRLAPAPAVVGAFTKGSHASLVHRGEMLASGTLRYYTRVLGYTGSFIATGLFKIRTVCGLG